MTDRYDGKPFLRLLDSYVLDTIGHLDEANRKWLVESEPYFRSKFGGTGSWRNIVANRMQFPEGIDAAIVETWEKGGARFRANTGENPEPVQFAHTFVDSNFPH